uniref:Putative membrane protein ycf78 n=1 Tax=Anthurium amnicola TaxID=1678845 RepID=A0A1D1YPC6_9ARAE
MAGPGTAVEPTAPNPGSPAKRVGEEEDLEAGAELGPKQVKMRDLESVLRSGGIKDHNSECSEAKDTTDHLSSNGNGTSQNMGMTESIHSHKHQLSAGGPGPLPPSSSAACLSLGLAGSSHAPMRATGAASSIQEGDVVKPTLMEGVDREHHASMKPSTGLDLDLNEINNTGVEHNPFYPYKKLGRAIRTDPSECGSTTGPLEESEPLRKWKEMKQNGFLSSSHGGIPSVPKQRVRQSKKRKEDDLKRKGEATKREPANRFTSIAAPSGLLCGLNPGIINHVRNKKQVHSIIEAMVRSEKADEQIHDESGGENKDDDRKSTQFSLSSTRLFSFSVPQCKIGKSHVDFAEEGCHNGSVSSQLTTGSEDDSLTLKLSPAGTMTSENASSMSSENISGSQGSVTALSFEAATVASQWLQLLSQDTKGRLAALRRSRKRVRNVLQKELPSLLSTELISNQENNHETSIMHVKRWKSLFSQMDKSLSEEGKYLERLLEQVREMQMKCDKGQKLLNDTCLTRNGSSDDTRLKKEETLQGEYAVRAAAASIYSTCNVIMTSENVPCF